MPTYNRAAILPRAVESVLSQSHHNWELLVVDDGSTDKTEEIVRGYTSDPRVRYFKTENRGVSSARNQGLSEAKGSLIAYLDSDNTWDEDFLRLLVVSIVSGGLDCAYSAVEVVDGAGATRFYRGDEFDWDRCRQSNYVDINALVHRPSSIEGVFDTKLRRMVDWDFILRLTRNARVGFVPFLGCRYVASHDDPLRITRAEPEVWAEVVRKRHAGSGAIVPWGEVASQLRLKFALKIAAPKDKYQEWGDFHFAKSLAKALEALGHEVRIDFKEDWQSAGQSDVNLVLRGLKEFTPLRGTINVLWNISHPDRLSRSELLGYQIVYTASQSHARLIGLELGAGGPPMRALLQCTDGELFNLARRSDASHHSADVLFVGNARADFRPMVRWALEVGLDIRIYGKGWSDIVEDARIRDILIDNEELGAAYANSRIVLNDHWPSMRDFGIISNRVFDVAATGTRLISDRHPALDSIFGSVVRQVDSAKELQLGTEEEGPPAEKLLELADWVISNHTFAQRARSIADDVLSYLNLPRIHETTWAADSVPRFMPRGDDRIKVGIVIPRSAGGVDSQLYVRLIGPLSTEYACHRLDVIEVEPHALPHELDALILQRPTVLDDDAETLARWAQDRKVNLIVDMTSTAPSESESFEPDADANTDVDTFILDTATSVWFSSKELQNRHQRPSADASVFADSIDPRVWRSYARSSDHHVSGQGSRRLLLWGSAANDREFSLVYPALRELATQFSFELFVLDGALKDVGDEPWLRFLDSPSQTASYSEFARWLVSKGPFDIGLAPVHHTRSNQDNSDIDFLNYSALGLISVVSDRPPYSGVVKGRGLAVVCPDSGWAHSLGEVFESPWRFTSLRDRAQQYVWSERTIEKTSKSIVSEIEQAVTRGRRSHSRAAWSDVP